MKSGRRLRAQLLATVVVAAAMLYCMATKSELYPFAPYTMYSNVHDIRWQTFFRFTCEARGLEVPLSNDMIRPFDEARLEMSFHQDVFGSPDPARIPPKLADLRETVAGNGFPCERAKLRLLRYEDAGAFLRDEGTVEEEYVSL